MGLLQAETVHTVETENAVSIRSRSREGHAVLRPVGSEADGSTRNRQPPFDLVLHGGGAGNERPLQGHSQGVAGCGEGIGDLDLRAGGGQAQARGRIPEDGVLVDLGPGDIAAVILAEIADLARGQQLAEGGFRILIEAGHDRRLQHVVVLKPAIAAGAEKGHGALFGRKEHGLGEIFAHRLLEGSGETGHAENEGVAAAVVHGRHILEPEQAVVRPDRAAAMAVKTDHAAALINEIKQLGSITEKGIRRTAGIGGGEEHRRRPGRRRFGGEGHPLGPEDHGVAADEKETVVPVAVHGAGLMVDDLVDDDLKLIGSARGQAADAEIGNLILALEQSIPEIAGGSAIFQSLTHVDRDQVERVAAHRGPQKGTVAGEQAVLQRPASRRPLEKGLDGQRTAAAVVEIVKDILHRHAGGPMALALAVLHQSVERAPGEKAAGGDHDVIDVAGR